MSDSLWPHGLQHTSLPCPSPSPRVCSNSRPLSQWCRPTISSSVVPLSFCLQSFPASGFLPMSRLFTSGGQSIRSSVSVLPMNIQGWFPLRLTGWISLQSKGLSRVFSNTTIWKHQFFGAQSSLWSNSLEPDSGVGKRQMIFLWFLTLPPHPSPESFIKGFIVSMATAEVLLTWNPCPHCPRPTRATVLAAELLSFCRSLSKGYLQWLTRLGGEYFVPETRCWDDTHFPLTVGGLSDK